MPVEVAACLVVVVRGCRVGVPDQDLCVGRLPDSRQSARIRGRFVSSDSLRLAGDHCLRNSQRPVGFHSAVRRDSDPWTLTRRSSPPSRCQPRWTVELTILKPWFPLTNARLRHRVEDITGRGPEQRPHFDHVQDTAGSRKAAVRHATPQLSETVEQVALNLSSLPQRSARE